MMSVLLLAGFIASALLVGFAAGRFLRSDSVFARACLTATLGPAALLALGNALGWVAAIHTVFWLLPILLLVMSAVLLWRSPRANRGDRPAHRVLFLLIVVILVAGAAYARAIGSDFWTPEYLAMPMHIMNGVFPVVEPTLPWKLASYHYGPMLLAAQVMSVTELPLLLAYALEPFLAAAGIVLGSAALGWTFTRSPQAALLCGLLGFLGAGFFWLQSIWLVRDLVEHFVLHQPIDAPAGETAFRWLTPMIRQMHSQSLAAMGNHRPISMGAGFLFPMLLSITEAWRAKTRASAAGWTVCAIIYGGAVALCLETSLVTLLAALAAAAALTVLLPQKEIPRTRIIGVSGAIIVCTALAALLLGGVLTSREGHVAASAFAFGFDGLLHVDGGPRKETIALWSWTFIRDFGLHIILLAIASAWAWKRRATTFLFLILIAWMHFLIPLFVRYPERYHEMNRFFFVAFGISSVVIGILLHETWLRGARWKRNAALAGIAGMLLAGTLNVLFVLAFPNLRLERSAILPQLPAATPEERKMAEWVLAADDRQHFYLPQQTTSRLDRVLFAHRTGRFVIDGSQSFDAGPALSTMEETCATAAAQALRIDFVVIPNAESASWFARHCTAEDWTLEYDGGASSRVYALR